MKTTALLSAACLALAAPAARAAAPASAPAADVKPAEARVTIPVGGMTCGGCVNNVSGRLSAVEGVTSVEVDLERKRAVVTYDAARVTVAQLAEVISAAGFEPGAPVAN